MKEFSLLPSNYLFHSSNGQMWENDPLELHNINRSFNWSGWQLTGSYWWKWEISTCRIGITGTAAPGAADKRRRRLRSARRLVREMTFLLSVEVVCVILCDPRPRRIKVHFLTGRRRFPVASWGHSWKWHHARQGSKNHKTMGHVLLIWPGNTWTSDPILLLFFPTNINKLSNSAPQKSTLDCTGGRVMLCNFSVHHCATFGILSTTNYTETSAKKYPVNPIFWDPVLSNVDLVWH